MINKRGVSNEVEQNNFIKIFTKFSLIIIDFCDLNEAEMV